MVGVYTATSENWASQKAEVIEATVPTKSKSTSCAFEENYRQELMKDPQRWAPFAQAEKEFAAKPALVRAAINFGKWWHHHLDI